MVAMKSKAEGKRVRAGVDTTERPILIPLFGRDALLEKRICLLERLAECADEIKQIDEQLEADLRAEEVQ
jgi:hypothetical protein